MKFTEEQVVKMASPISKSEEEKCKNAIRMVRDAMKKLYYTDDGKEIRTYMEETYSFALDLRHQFSGRRLTLLVQGSYANKTNISSESDVDVAVILESTFIPNYRTGISGKSYGFADGSFSVFDLKDEVQRALEQHFSNQGVERHDKSIKIIGNTYRVDADVVPAYRYRDYRNDYANDPNNYIGGIEIHPDSGGYIINFPEQHIKNGIVKNGLTKYNFKRCVRIAKSIREEMESRGYCIPNSISSFGIESLLWNVNNSVYTKYASILRFTFDEVLAFLVSNFPNFYIYTEANGIKPLFTSQPLLADYQNFVTDMRAFFEYSI